MKKSRLLGAACTCVLVLLTTTTNAAVMPLESRLGGLASYDPNLDSRCLHFRYRYMGRADCVGSGSVPRWSQWMASTEYGR